MPRPGLFFSQASPPLPRLSTRADVALFVGLIARTQAAPSDAQMDALEAGGWIAPLAVPGPRPTTRAAIDAATAAQKADRLAAAMPLLGLPVAVESFESFATLYDWQCRPVEVGATIRIGCPLGLAVHAFFAEGGRRAYIVRTGDPLPLADSRVDADQAAFAAAKLALLDWPAAKPPADAADRHPLIPGLVNFAARPDPGNRSSWRGAAAIFGLDDVALLALPDLVDLCAGSPLPAASVPPPPASAEQFKPCAAIVPDAAPALRPALPQWQAPRLDQTGYARWAGAVRAVLDLLARPAGPAHRRDVMLIGAAPLPRIDAGFDHGEERNPLAVLAQSGAVIADQSLLSAAHIGSARLQLGYPWIATAISGEQPEGLAGPEGALAGILARTALESGAFRSAADRPSYAANGLWPRLGSADLDRAAGDSAGWLGSRLCLFGERAGVLRLLSDATTAESRSWQPGGVSRLMGIILRAGRHLGSDLIFEPSGPLTWVALRGRIEQLMEQLRALGAFSGASAEECYAVRCDAGTMSRADLDAGRLIAQIGFAPAYPVERITVLLDLTGGNAAPVREAA